VASYPTVLGLPSCLARPGCLVDDEEMIDS